MKQKIGSQVCGPLSHMSCFVFIQQRIFLIKKKQTKKISF